jgi:phosphate starvation-inducible protein PhoH
VKAPKRNDDQRASAAMKAWNDRCAASLKRVSNEQRCILEAIYKGQSVFFTGSAGTGKSFLLQVSHMHMKSILVIVACD